MQEESYSSVAVAPPETPSKPVNWRKSITKHTVTCLECGASFKQLSVRRLRDYGLDGRSYRVKYDMPRTQPLAAKEVTSRRKEIVQRIRPWQKAPTYLKAQAKAQQAVAQGKERQSESVDCCCVLYVPSVLVYSCAVGLRNRDERDGCGVLCA